MIYKRRFKAFLKKKLCSICNVAEKEFSVTL